MLDQVKINNFQSHSDTEINFHPGINIISGESDVGKSAIIRAMLWVSLNQPSGDEFRRHGTKQTCVEMDGVKKFRSASNHYYEMGGQKFKALRTDVPLEIQNKIKLKAVNSQLQHAPYFLISDSPGAVAKALNAVGDLSIIDLSLKAARAKVKEANIEGVHLKEEVAKVTDKIDALSWAVEADVDYQTIEWLQKDSDAIEISGLTSAINKVEQLKKSYEALPETGGALNKISKAIKDLDIDLSIGNVIAKVEANAVIIPEMAEDLIELGRLELELESLTSSCGTYTNKILPVEAAQVDLDQYPTEIDGVSEILNKLTTADQDLKQMDAAFTEAFIAEDCLEEADAAHNEGKINFNDKLKEMGHCPLCNGELHENNLSG